MDLGTIESLITSLGFPIVCVIGMAWFAFYLVKSGREESQHNMEKLQENCKAREEKLYAEIAENRKINADAVKIITKYAESLDIIQSDVSDIKTDITVLKTKSEGD